MMITCIISFVIGAFTMLCAIGLMSCQKDNKSRNKVHFYVARDKDYKLWLYLGKPIRYEDQEIFISKKYDCGISYSCSFKYLGLNEADYKDLKWEDEPIEVFLNLED